MNVERGGARAFADDAEALEDGEPVRAVLGWHVPPIATLVPGEKLGRAISDARAQPEGRRCTLQKMDYSGTQCN